PSQAIAPSSVLVAITGRDGERIEIGPEDLIEEPDALASYEAMQAFFARQEVIAEALGMKPVVIETEHLSIPRRDEVLPPSQRPATSLLPAFWMQIGVGLAGFWIGAWIWALRRGEWATRLLLLAGGWLVLPVLPAVV